MITAVFHWLGTVPVANDWLKSWHSGAAKIGATSRQFLLWPWTLTFELDIQTLPTRCTLIYLLNYAIKLYRRAKHLQFKCPSLQTSLFRLAQAGRQEIKWGGGVFVKKWKMCGCFFVKKWTFPRRRVHYVQYQYFLFYILLTCGGAYAPAYAPAYGPASTPTHPTKCSTWATKLVDKNLGACVIAV